MNEQNQRLDVIKKRCFTSTKVISVLQIIAIVGIIGALVGAICCFIWKDAINVGMAEQVASGKATVESLKFDAGILDFKIDYEEAFSHGNYATPIIINCIIAITITGVCLFLLTAYKKIFKDLIKEDNPFSDSILKRLRICSIVIVIILGVFAGIGAAVIIGLLLWCIHSVLEYGKALQTEVDEML